jgi:hypothetical protein
MTVGTIGSSGGGSVGGTGVGGTGVGGTGVGGTAVGGTDVGGTEVGATDVGGTEVGTFEVGGTFVDVDEFGGTGVCVKEEVVEVRRGVTLMTGVFVRVGVGVRVNVGSGVLVIKMIIVGTVVTVSSSVASDKITSSSGVALAKTIRLVSEGEPLLNPATPLSVGVIVGWMMPITTSTGSSTRVAAKNPVPNSVVSANSRIRIARRFELRLWLLTAASSITEVRIDSRVLTESLSSGETRSRGVMIGVKKARSKAVTKSDAEAKRSVGDFDNAFHKT